MEEIKTEEEKRIRIDDSNKDWYADIVIFEKIIALSFELRDGEHIQGEVDETFGFDEIPIGIDNLEIMMCAGTFMVDFQDYSDEKAQAVEQSIIDYLTKFYFDNKKKLVKNIKKDVKDILKFRKQYNL